MQLGTGGVMDRIDYLSEEIGTSHQHSILQSETAIYWVDALKGKMCMFNGAVSLLSDASGMLNFIENLSKNFINQGQIHGAYDYKNHDVIYTFTDIDLVGAGEGSVGDGGYNTAKTIVYNELIKGYTSFWTAYPSYWMKFGDTLYSEKGIVDNALARNQVYRYSPTSTGSFFGSYKDSTIEVVLNEKASLSKVFDNLAMAVNPEGYALVNQIVLTTENGSQTLSFPDTRTKYRELLYRLPLRNSSATGRVRGRWCKLKINFDNNSSKNVVLSLLESKYRLSSKS